MADKINDSKSLAAAAGAAYSKYASDGGADSLRKLYDILHDLNSALREEMQRATLEPVRIIISRIEQGVPLTPEDLQFIRLWLVGDAEAYVARETDFQNWQAELTRLMDLVGAEAPAAASVKAAMDLQAAVTDAMMVIPSLQRYLESRDRVRRFESSTRSIDAGTALAIKNLLEGKIKSQND